MPKPNNTYSNSKTSLNLFKKGSKRCPQSKRRENLKKTSRITQSLSTSTLMTNSSKYKTETRSTNKMTASIWIKKTRWQSPSIKMVIWKVAKRLTKMPSRWSKGAKGTKKLN